jgi:hypothetical protein
MKKAHKLLEAINAGGFFNLDSGRRVMKCSPDSKTHQTKIRKQKFIAFRESGIYYTNDLELDDLLKTFEEFEKVGDISEKDVDECLEKYITCLEKRRLFNVSSRRCVMKKNKGYILNKKYSIVHKPEHKALADAIVKRYNELPKYELEGNCDGAIDIATGECRRKIPEGKKQVVVGGQRVFGSPERINALKRLDKEIREEHTKKTRKRSISRSPSKKGVHVCQYCNKDCSNKGCTFKHIREKLKSQKEKGLSKKNKAQLCDVLNKNKTKSFTCRFCNEDCSNKGCSMRLIEERLHREDVEGVTTKNKDQLCDILHGRKDFKRKIRPVHRCGKDCKGCTIKVLQEKLKHRRVSGYSNKRKSELCHMLHSIMPDTSSGCLELSKIHGVPVTESYISQCVWETVDVDEWDRKVARINLLVKDDPIEGLDHYEDLDETLRQYEDRHVTIQETIMVPPLKPTLIIEERSIITKPAVLLPKIIEVKESKVVEDEESKIIEVKESKVVEDEESKVVEDEESKVVEDLESRVEKPASEEEVIQEALSRMAVRDIPDPIRLSADARHIIPRIGVRDDVISLIQEAHGSVFLGSHGLKSKKKEELLKQARSLLKIK